MSCRAPQWKLEGITDIIIKNNNKGVENPKMVFSSQKEEESLVVVGGFGCWWGVLVLSPLTHDSIPWMNRLAKWQKYLLATQVNTLSALPVCIIFVYIIRKVHKMYYYVFSISPRARKNGSYVFEYRKHTGKTEMRGKS